MDQNHVDKKAAWNVFLHTGRVEDYLQYVRVQGIAGVTDAGEEMTSDAEDYDRWDCDRYT